MKLEQLSEGDEVVFQGYENERQGCLRKGQVYKVHRGKTFFYVNCEKSVFAGPHTLTSDEDVSGFAPFIQQRGGWIGVDLDGTLAVYDKWRGPYHIGEPIPAMVERVKRWLSEGRDVRIFTARVTQRDHNEDGTEHDIEKVVAEIEKYCAVLFGKVLPITNIKDWHMVELWDDRCVQMVPNTGRTLAEEHEAVRMADAGKAASA